MSTFLICFFVFRLFFQTDIAFQTVSLWNKEYIEITQNEFAISDTEDIFNDKYGGYNFTLISAKNPNVIKPTVSLNLLEIGFDIINTSPHNYLIENIKIDNLKPYDLTQIKHNTGKWQGLPFKNNYQSAFNIELSSNLKSVTYFPKESIVYTDSLQMDNRINLAITGASDLKNQLVSFDVIVNLSAIGTEESIQVKSNKTYFLAFK